jgi:predicted DNA-binding transcriptional regulator AlpA
LLLRCQTDKLPSIGNQTGANSCVPTCRSDVVVEKLLSTKELAELLGVKLNTLHVWRKGGVGPRSVNVGYRVKYRPSDVDAWLDEHASPSIQRTEDTRPGVVARRDIVEICG